MDVDAALREGLKPSQGEPAAFHTVGDFSIDYAPRRLTVAGESVALPTTEYATLQQLAGGHRGADPPVGGSQRDGFLAAQHDVTG